MNTILVVDDDPAILSGITILLEQAGYHVLQASNGADARRLLANKPDLVILDIMLPDDDGIELCRVIRQQTHYTPVLMLSAKDQTQDKVAGLDVGADDYVTKPFEPSELLARVRARLRTQPAQPTMFTYHELTLNVEQHTAHCNGHELELTTKEWDVLRLLIQQSEQVVGRTALINHAWDTDYLGDSRMVDMCVLRLRGKIEQFAPNVTLIQTVRGVGYKLLRMQHDE